MSSESTTSEESTTSSREGQEDDAISSNSSEDGENHVICPKSRNKSHQPALSSSFPKKKKASNTKSPSPRKPRQAMKRSRDQENKQNPQTDAADSPLRCSPVKHVDSEIGPHSSQESPKKLREVFSVHPFLSESDINSEGEATKTYTVPAKHISESVIPGEMVPTAFAKTNIKTKESQIY